MLESDPKNNEISNNMKHHIKDKYKFNIELVPPGCHRRNAAEVAIRNFKAHFLSVLAGTADSFPMSLWDKLLPQTELTLNLLRQSNATPTVSAYAHLVGPFDYNKMPLAPMGCEVQVHEKTDKRGTWAFHSLDGWYLQTSLEHYRVHKCHIKKTHHDRLSDTVQFQHKNITNPSISPQDKIMEALANCKAALTGCLKHSPTQQLQELRQLMENVSPKLQQTATIEVPRVKVGSHLQANDVPRVDRAPKVATVIQDTMQVPRVEKKVAAQERTTRAVQLARTKLRKRRSLAHLTAPIHNPSAPPALSTRSRVKATKIVPPPAPRRST